MPRRLFSLKSFRSPPTPQVFEAVPRPAAPTSSYLFPGHFPPLDTYWAETRLGLYHKSTFTDFSLACFRTERRNFPPTLCTSVAFDLKGKCQAVTVLLQRHRKSVSTATQSLAGRQLPELALWDGITGLHSDGHGLLSLPISFGVQSSQCFLL